MPGLGKFLSASTQATSVSFMPQALKMACPLAKSKKNPTGQETEMGLGCLCCPPLSPAMFVCSTSTNQNLIIYVSSKIFFSIMLPQKARYPICRELQPYILEKFAWPLATGV